MAKNPTYYDGDLAADLIAAGLEAIEADGPAAVSMRSLARGLGVSNAAPKNHFADKAALFAAIAVEGFDGLNARLADVTGTDRDAASALVDAGVAYVAHALEHPAHFAVMWQTDLHGHDPRVAEAAARAYATLVGLVGGADSSDATDRANQAWALAHGWASLLLSGSLTVPPGISDLDYVRRQLHASGLGERPRPDTHLGP